MTKEHSEQQKDLRIRSKVISEGVSRTPNRAYLRALGFEDEDFQKPMIGVASTWSEVTPCNMHIDGLARASKQGISEAGASPLIFKYHYSIRWYFNGNRRYALLFTKS